MKDKVKKLYKLCSVKNIELDKMLLDLKKIQQIYAYESGQLKKLISYRDEYYQVKQMQYQRESQYNLLKMMEVKQHFISKLQASIRQQEEVVRALEEKVTDVSLEFQKKKSVINKIENIAKNKESEWKKMLDKKEEIEVQSLRKWDL